MTPQNEPVVLSAVIKVVVMVGARYGLNFDATELFTLFVAMETVLAPVVRKFVHPSAKVQKILDELSQLKIGAANTMPPGAP